MGTRHPKSPCCGAIVQRFGGRRRRCSQCHRTWRIRRRKPGRKRRRVAPQLVTRTLAEQRPLVRQARPAGVSLPALRKRFRAALTWWLAHSTAPGVPPGPLVLLVDGVWFRFGRQVWTLYVMALKPVGCAQATFLDPLLLPAREALAGWQQAVATIPAAVRRHIRALVSDGFRGSASLARHNGWIHQRCHFHLIAQLQIRRGQHKHLATAPLREAMYQALRTALGLPEGPALRQLETRLATLAQRPKCPRRFRMAVRDFLRQRDAFRAYQRYPELELPTTTNVVEAMARILRTRLPPLSTPEALQRWATALIRLRPTMVCNGHRNQPN